MKIILPIPPQLYYVTTLPSKTNTAVYLFIDISGPSSVRFKVTVILNKRRYQSISQV